VDGGMKTTYRKVFWTFEQKELWLNEMSRKGLHLTSARWPWHYDFVENPALRYVYHVEYIPKLSFTDRGDRYLMFLRDSGFLYLPTSVDFSFSIREYSQDVYTAPQYRQKHYARIAETLWWPFGAAALGINNYVMFLQNNMGDRLAAGYHIFWAIILCIFIFGIAQAVSNLVPALRGWKEAKAELIGESAVEKG
jgi:hypothetical protein